MISTPNSARLSIQMRAGYYVESKMYIFARKVGNGPSRDLYLGRWIQSVSRICSDLFICLRLMMMSLWFFVSELALERESKGERIRLGEDYHHFAALAK